MFPFYSIPGVQSPTKKAFIDEGEWPCDLCGQILLKNPVTGNWESAESLDVCDGRVTGILHAPAVTYPNIAKSF